MTTRLGTFGYGDVLEWGKDRKEESWVIPVCQIENVDIRGVICEDQITSSGFSVRDLGYVLVSVPGYQLRPPVLSCEVKKRCSRLFG